jgi:hypothetical protein
MSQSAQNFIILPYFCEEEVIRYLKIAERLKSFPEPEGGYHFLLAASPKTKTHPLLVNAYSRLGRTISYTCPTQIFGYPEGPTAMFWDCMDFLADNYGDRPGYALWLESDMAPTQPDWIDRLSREWFSSGETPIMMGCYIPEVYKQRWFKPKKLILHAHINGGACYALNFAKQMPAEARDGVFDMAVYRFAEKIGKIKPTSQIAFSTLSRVRRDLLDDSKVLLHGFMQDKDVFIQRCLDPVTENERRARQWHPLLETLENFNRRIRIQFVRKGKSAMYENMFIAKQQFELEQKNQARQFEQRNRAA